MRRIRPEDWYSVRRLDDDVTYICEPYIQEFYRCNVWHIRGRDRDMLVDSGMGVVSLREWVPLVTERELIAVASHTHFDHIGCHHEFECRAVHSAEANLLAEPTRKNTLADPYVTDEIFDALPPEPYCSKCYAVKKAPATRILEDGDVIDLGDRQFGVHPDQREDVVVAQQRRARPVGPQHLVERHRQHEQRVAGGQPPAHRFQHGDIEEGIGPRTHGLRRSALSVNGSVINARPACVQICPSRRRANCAIG